MCSCLHSVYDIDSVWVESAALLETNGKAATDQTTVDCQNKYLILQVPDIATGQPKSIVRQTAKVRTVIYIVVWLRGDEVSHVSNPQCMA